MTIQGLDTFSINHCTYHSLATVYDINHHSHISIMKQFILHLILLFINVFSQLKSEMTIQEMNASEDGKNMTVLASDPSNGMTIVRFLTCF